MPADSPSGETGYGKNDRRGVMSEGSSGAPHRFISSEAVGGDPGKDLAPSEDTECVADVPVSVVPRHPRDSH